MKCCDHDQSTPFCAWCGNELIPAMNLPSLLAHCRPMAVRLTNAAKRLAAHVMNLDETDPRNNRVIARARKADEAAAKWQGWTDDLEAAIPLLLEKRRSEREP